MVLLVAEDTLEEPVALEVSAATLAALDAVELVVLGDTPELEALEV